MAARPNVAAAEFSYIEMMFPETFDPEISLAGRGKTIGEVSCECDE